MRPQRKTADLAPSDCWYGVAAADAVGRQLTGLRLLDRPVLLYRTQDGHAVALEDRCAHRAYPLSAGTLVGDDVQCGLCGFVYGTDGVCSRVPTQARVPLGAHVASYPVQETDGVVWVWLGEPGRARRHRVPELAWLAQEGWATVAGERVAAAGFLLLLENFADVTQVPFVAPEIAPSALGQAPPELDVEVTETTVTLLREFPAAVLPPWQARMLGVDVRERFTTSQRGFFLSPAVWVDYWDVTGSDGRTARLRFTHLVTPVSEARSRVLWRVSRDFALDDAGASAAVAAMFEDYYRRVFAAMETAQAALDLDGPGAEVNVSADVAALRVREIVTSMLAEELPVRAARVPAAGPHR
ncbi:MAG TPA: Rieske 2Fe-2S domain-containing protein [Kineosporiaceae bacterium]|nr:Rieske 2Fe-2S domain-containing protein [Kineosporiaceae bacterium]